MDRLFLSAPYVPLGTCNKPNYPRQSVHKLPCVFLFFFLNCLSQFLHSSLIAFEAVTFLRSGAATANTQQIMCRSS